MITVIRYTVLFLFCLQGRELCAQPLELLCLNIRYDNPADGGNAWPLRRERMAHWIQDSVQPDIICLQEVLHHQLTFLDSVWKEDYVFYGVGREDGLKRGEYAPIFYRSSRFKCIYSETVWLSPTPAIPSKGWDAACERILSIVYLQDLIRKDTLCVFNTHWDHIGTEARANSADLLLEKYFRIPAHWRFFAAGDFNARSDEPSIVQLSKEWRDICPLEMKNQATFNGFNDAKTFERIDFVGPESNVSSILIITKGDFLVPRVLYLIMMLLDGV